MHRAPTFAPRPSTAVGRTARVLALSLLSLAWPLWFAAWSPARAGEVRVNVGVGGNLFNLRAINCNNGDHVIWVWSAGSHTSTAGDSETTTPSGQWDSGLLTAVVTNNTTAFSWQATGVGVFPYYCIPHALFGMAGRVIVAASGIAVSDLRITEVQYNEAAGHDLIEITNLGGAAGDLGRYRLSISTGVAVSLPSNTIPIAVNGTVTIHTNESGTNTASDVFLGTLGALGDAAGSVALYVPNTKSGTSLNDDTQIADYVEWGATGQPNETTAVNAGVWPPGVNAPSVAAGHSVEFCTVAEPRPGSGRWFDNPAPNFGGAADNCATPVRGTTWGRIKTLYR